MPPLYLTPRRYATMGQGIDLSAVEDQDLASQIQIASGLVNAYCNVDHEHDFRGGSVVGEEHPWKIGNYMWPESGRVFPLHQPLLALDLFRIHVTNTQYLEVPPARVHYHTFSNSLEPVIAASSIGVWSYSAVPIAGYRVPYAAIDYDYGWLFTETDETLYPDGGIRWRSGNQWWTDAPVELKVNGTVIDTAKYTVDRSEGTVDIDDDAMLDLDISASEIDTVRATYQHKLPSNVMTATALIVTSLLGQQEIAAKGLLGLSGIRVEEVEIRQSRDAQSARDDIPGLAKELLRPYRRLSWG